MTRLDNTRHERFAVSVAAGMPASRAYQAAGFTAKGNSAEVNACRLLRVAQVRTRVDELLGESAKELSITKAHLWMLLEDRRLAHEKGQAAAAGAITERIGKLYGFAFDPAKQGDPSLLVSANRPEPTMIDFKAVNELFKGM